MLNDFARGWRQNFWVMETQPGSVNRAPMNTLARDAGIVAVQAEVPLLNADQLSVLPQEV